MLNIILCCLFENESSITVNVIYKVKNKFQFQILNILNYSYY
jgi:hypothetical protein